MRDVTGVDEVRQGIGEELEAWAGDGIPPYLEWALGVADEALWQCDWDAGAAVSDLPAAFKRSVPSLSVSGSVLANCAGPSASPVALSGSVLPVSAGTAPSA